MNVPLSWKELSDNKVNLSIFFPTMILKVSKTGLYSPTICHGLPCTNWNNIFTFGMPHLFSSADIYQFYPKDRLGLQEMNKAGKLHFLTAIGDHLRFTDEFFEENILPFLKE